MTDADHVQQWSLLLDFKPVRPSRVSTTEEERKAAQERAYEAAIYLRSKGWPIPVAGCSGNSYHLLYPIDLPDDQESKELVEKVRSALTFVLADDKVKLDINAYSTATIRKADDGRQG